MITSNVSYKSVIDIAKKFAKMYNMSKDNIDQIVLNIDEAYMLRNKLNGRQKSMFNVVLNI